MDEKPAAARRPRFDSRAENLFFHGAGGDPASPARPRLDSIPISPLDHVVGAAGDNDSEFGGGEFAYSSPPRKQLHASSSKFQTAAAAAATANTNMTSPQQPDTQPFKLMPSAVQRHHLSPSSPSLLTHPSENNHFWACDDSTMTTKKQAPALSSPTLSTLILPHRDNAFSAASWWLVDREHEPPLLQGATALAERCLKTFPGWDEPFVRRILKAYRQYLAMVVSTNDWKGSKLIPPPLVRQVWELHRKDIVAYCHDCMILFGQLVGNNLQDDNDNDSFITPQQAQRRDVTLQTLQSQFGKQYDEQIWTYEVEKNVVNDGPTNGANGNAVAAGSGSAIHDSATGSTSSTTGSSSSSSSSSSTTTGDVARTTQDTARNQQAPRDPTGRVNKTGAGANRGPKEGSLMEDRHTMGDEDEKQNDEDYTLFPDLAEQAKAEPHALLSNDSSKENDDQDDSHHSGSDVNNQQDKQRQQQRETEYEDEIEDENDNDSEDEEDNDRTHHIRGRKDARKADDNDEDDETHGRSSSLGAIISICVRTKDDKDSKTWFRVRPDTRMGKVFENLPYIKFGVTTPNTTKFYVQGAEDRPIRPADTVEKLDLWDQDVIILKASAKADDDFIGEKEGDDVIEKEMEEDAFDGERGEGDKSNSIDDVEAQASTEQAGPSQPQDGNQTSTSEVKQNISTRGQEEMTSPTVSVIDVKVTEAPEKVAEEEDNKKQEGAGTPARADEELVLKKMRKSKGSVVDSVEYADDENMAKTDLLESKSNLPALTRADEKHVLKRKGRSRRSVVESVEYADKGAGTLANLGSEHEPGPAPKRRKKSPKRTPESTKPTCKRTSRRKVKPEYFSPSEP